ncbi:MAG: hypothetical protein ACP5VE_02400 [Chthonomonadales bacterium]
MTEHPDARRMKLLQMLADAPSGIPLPECARALQVDERTIRRDALHLQELLSKVHGVTVRRNVLVAEGEGLGPGYFAKQVQARRHVKEAIARRIVSSLADNTALAITAGTSTYYVAREIRRASLEQTCPSGLIVFTNSLPALMELISAGVSTGVIGEVFNPDDYAFHTHELHSTFNPGIAIVGASGILPNPATGSLDLFSHRAEEAAFMKQVLAPVPEIVIAADASKIGRRHPWSFTSGGILAGKLVRLYTDPLAPDQREPILRLASTTHRSGFRLILEEVDPGNELP